MSNNGDLGARLKGARKAKKWRQIDLAMRSGVSLRSIAGYELGETPGAEAIRKLCTALDITSDLLLGLPAHPPIVAPAAPGGE